MFDAYTAARKPQKALWASFGGAAGFYGLLGIALSIGVAARVVGESAPINVTFYSALPAAPPPPPRGSRRAAKVSAGLLAPATLPTFEAATTPSNDAPQAESGPAGDAAGVEGGVDGGVAGGAVGGVVGGSGSGAGPVILPGGATPPVRLNPGVVPEYPEAARALNAVGEVIVKVVVRADGSVELVRMLKSDAMFDAAVRAVLPKLRYKPAIYNGQAIAVYQNIRFPFSLTR